MTWERSSADPARRGGGLVVLAGLLAAIVLGGALARLDARPVPEGIPVAPDAGPPVTASPPTANPSRPPRDPARIGTWVKLPPAPVEVPGEHVGVWTGKELVVQGGDAFAAYRPEDEAWRRLPPPPSGHGQASAMVWTGEKVITWNGRAGFAYHPEADRWRRLPPAPKPITDPVAVWTGERVLLWGPLPYPEGIAIGLAYHPATDAWRGLAPAPVKHVERATGLWNGEELVVWGHGREGKFAAWYRPNRGYAPGSPGPREDRWRSLSPPPLANPAEAAAVWTGRGLLLWGEPGGTVLWSHALEWRLLPPAPNREPPYAWEWEGMYGLVAAWTGEQMLIVGGYPQGAGLAFHPHANAWELLAPGPVTRLNAVGAWTGEELLVWGSYGPHGPHVELDAWRP